MVEEILRQLSLLGSSQQFKLQATFALELLLRLSRYADLSKEHTYQLAFNLWLLALKHESQLESNHIVSCNEVWFVRGILLMFLFRFSYSPAYWKPYTSYTNCLRKQNQNKQ